MRINHIHGVLGFWGKLVVLRRGEKVCEKMIKDSSTEEAPGLITGAIDRA